MKLLKDFGVRALLAVMAGVGFYILLITLLVNYTMDLPTMIAVTNLANAPWLIALGFYFGHKTSPPSP